MVSLDANSLNIFFALLRSGLYGVPIPKSAHPDIIDWETIIQICKKHVIFGIIIDSIQFLPERLRPSGLTLAKMNKFALGLIQTNLILDKSTTRLVSFLNDNGIPGVLLKGQGVARYYRMPQMRQCGDIDFYVGKNIYKKAVDLCLNNIADNKASCSETEQHFDFFMGDIPIELHRLASRIYSPIRNRRFQKWVVEELECSPARRTLTINSTDITLPSFDFDAIFIFYHAWRHYIMGGIGLRQLCDWAMIFHTHGDDIDTRKLKDNITRFGMTKGWKLFACIAVNHLGLSHDKMPLYDPTYSKKSEKVLEDILAGGNFGYYSQANTRTPVFGLGLWNGFGKVRNITNYFFSLFPLIPIEATFLYFNRLIFGTISHTKRSLRKPSN